MYGTKINDFVKTWGSSYNYGADVATIAGDSNYFMIVGGVFNGNDFTIAGVTLVDEGQYCSNGNSDCQEGVAFKTNSAGNVIWATQFGGNQGGYFREHTARGVAVRPVTNAVFVTGLYETSLKIKNYMGGVLQQNLLPSGMSAPACDSTSCDYATYIAMLDGATGQASWVNRIECHRATAARERRDGRCDR